MTDNLKYTLALGQIDGIGPNIGRKLIRHFGDAQAVFKSTSKDFDLIKGAGRSLRKQIQGFKDFSYIEQELDYIEKNNLNVYEYNTDDYPKRLNHCTDGPLAVFSRGIKNLNHPRALAIVGTRMATDYGKTFTQKLISELAEHNVAIYSGLAYGIDIAAKQGTMIISSGAGVVTMAEDDLYYTGGTIIMDHGHGISTIYSHLENILVSVGDQINQGDVIGTVGSTGRSTGPHLDFRINWFQTRLDPLSVIAK